jgi:hypothetical protein
MYLIFSASSLCSEYSFKSMYRAFIPMILFAHRQLSGMESQNNTASMDYFNSCLRKYPYLLSGFEPGMVPDIYRLRTIAHAEQEFGSPGIRILNSMLTGLFQHRYFTLAPFPAHAA